MRLNYGYLTVGLACAAWLGVAAASSYADEVSTTTHTETTTTHTEPVDVPPPPPPSSSSGCVTQKKTTTNEDTGESVSKTTTDCD